MKIVLVTNVFFKILIFQFDSKFSSILFKKSHFKTFVKINVDKLILKQTLFPYHQHCSKKLAFVTWKPNTTKKSPWLGGGRSHNKMEKNV